MGLPKKKNEGKERFSYADLLSWPEEERWELIDGIAWDFAAPSTAHQQVSMNLSVILSLHLKDKPCRVFAAPFDVFLNESFDVPDEELYTVVQPDLTVVCDQEKLVKRGCQGSPDLVVEIFSEYTSFRDISVKLNLYEKHGIREYWFVNPAVPFVMVYHLEDGHYGEPEYLKDHGILRSRVLFGLSIPVREIFSGIDPADYS